MDSKKQEEFKNITIMKYRTHSGQYKFEVMDRWDVPNEADRLDKMIALGNQYLLIGKAAEILWIKNTVII